VDIINLRSHAQEISNVQTYSFYNWCLDVLESESCFLFLSSVISFKTDFYGKSTVTSFNSKFSVFSHVQLYQGNPIATQQNVNRITESANCAT